MHFFHSFLILFVHAYVLVPSPRQFHSTTICRGNIYLFGGYNGTNLHDFHSAVISSNVVLPFKQLSPAVEMISPRRGHLAITYDKWIIVHGGRDKSGSCNDAYVFGTGTVRFGSPVTTRFEDVDSNYLGHETFRSLFSYSLCVVRKNLYIRRFRNARRRQKCKFE